MTLPISEVKTWLADQTELRIVTLADTLVERLGHGPRSTYAETYWLPVVGPSALWAMRRLSAWIEAEPGGTTVALAHLAGELGLGAGTGRNSPLIRTLARLVMFEMAEIDLRRGAMAVRLVLPPLAARHLHRLPGHLAARCMAESVGHPRRATSWPTASGTRCG